MKLKHRRNLHQRRKAQLKRLRNEWKVHALKLALINDRVYRLIARFYSHQEPINEFLPTQQILESLGVKECERNWKLLINAIASLQKVQE